MPIMGGKEQIMRMRRIYERLRYSMIGNLIMILGLIAFIYLGYLVLFWLIESADKLNGWFGLAFVLYLVGLNLVHFLANYHKTRRYQRTVYGIGPTKMINSPAERRLDPDARCPQPRLERLPDEKALRRMERAREKAERSLERDRARAERRERKENAKW